MSKHSAGLYIKILSCVGATIFAIPTLVNFGCFIKWRNNLTVPSYLLVIFDAALFCRERICKRKKTSTLAHNYYRIGSTAR